MAISGTRTAASALMGKVRDGDKICIVGYDHGVRQERRARASSAPERPSRLAEVVRRTPVGSDKARRAR